jgi:hypothetical protein
MQSGRSGTGHDWGVPVEMASASPAPFQVVRQAAPVRRATKQQLLAIVRRLERHALVAPPRVVLASLQDVRYLSPGTRRVYRALAAAGSSCVLYARDLPTYLGPGVTGVALDDDTPLVDLWSVVLVSATQPVALTATDLHEPAAGEDGRGFQFAVTRDPDVVDACAAAFPAP